MVKQTFVNLSEEKKDKVIKVLVDVFYDKHISQVTVSEIVEKLGMSRGAFYKYFEDIHDAYYTISQICAYEVHIMIMNFIQRNSHHFFIGLEKYLSYCADLEKKSYEWKVIQLLTLTDAKSLSIREPVTEELLHSQTTKEWMKLLERNDIYFSSSEEGLSFLYFIMNMVTTSLEDFIVNQWSKYELLKDFSYKQKWIIYGIK